MFILFRKLPAIKIVLGFDELGLKGLNKLINSVTLAAVNRHTVTSSVSIFSFQETRLKVHHMTPTA
jgi:hypothetical protein